MRASDRNKKIIILGAGIGGLYVAGALGNLGFSIVVYEKKSREELGYPWHDSINKDTFKKAKIEVPKHFVLQKQLLNFFGPSGDGYISQGTRAAKNFDIDRKKFIEHLIVQAEQCATIRFGTKADSLILENDAVVGVYVNGQPQYCDLVIDSSGLFSKYRFQIPHKFLMDDAILPNDYLMAYRAYYKKDRFCLSPSNVYLMPSGFSVLWCKDAPDANLADILISHFESLSQAQIDKALAYLRERNPHITDERVFSVQDAIPVRYPLATIVADGYALIGNAAFMTKPTSGSGIENTLNAAVILADVVKNAANFSARSLWKYAVKVNSAFGAHCYMSYIARANFQNLNRDDLIWLFTSGVLNEHLLALARFDIKNMSDFKIESVIKSLQLAKSKPDFMRSTEDIIKLCIKASLLARRMPRVYNEAAIAKWKAEYDAFARTPAKP
ncbi:MAG: hypothetical protein NC037_06470 [Bacteroides sp.]|nr:hypothetical protein [Bacillota bacterium]MCM1394002.1 hypothetical protein [[Eubacterium] siraeum]MCM1456148.1 hypothetical protein [Bacteroides sp.]